MLLYGRLRVAAALLFHWPAEQLDVTGDEHRVKVFERHPAFFAPIAELPDRTTVSHPGVRVPDVRGEELDELERRSFASGADERRHPGKA